MTAVYDPSAFREVFETHFTYWSGFHRNTHRYARRTALRCPHTGRVWTYQELGEDVERLAAGLAARGVRAGDLVVYQLFNCPEFALLYLATQRLDAIGSPANFRLAPGETAHLVDSGEPRAFVYDSTLAGATSTALDLATHQPELLVEVPAPDTEPVEPLPGSQLFAELLRDGDRAEPLAQPNAGIYAETTRLYTSGTTGLPKGVPLNNAVEVLSAHDVIMHFPLTPEDRILNMSPWFHRGGLYAGGPNPTFYVGGESVTMRHFDAETTLDWVQDYGLTFLVGAPTNLELLADAQQRHPRDLSTLRGIVTMGAPLERKACLRYQELLTERIFNGYGTTEAFWNTFLRPSDLPDKAGSAGRACTDDDVAVVRVYEDRRAAPDDLAAKDGHEIGEVIVRSPKSGFAYLGRPEEERENFRDGWLYIGDLATWDEDEYVTLVGRLDDRIISGGENVYPVQVEEVLNELEGVQDVAVVGVPDQRWGQLVAAYVVRQGPELTVADCERHCRSHPMLATYKRPRAYRFVDSLPRTSTGKKIHYQIREQASEDDASGALERV